MISFGMMALVVDDYDKALPYYRDVLGFTLIEDTDMGNEKRWVVLEPSSSGARILLARATTEEQRAAIGNATGGRVAFFLYTTEFDETYERYLARGVEFVEEPRHETFGRVVVFADCYGNKWDLIESSEL